MWAYLWVRQNAVKCVCERNECANMGTKYNMKAKEKSNYFHFIYTGNWWEMEQAYSIRIYFNLAGTIRVLGDYRGMVIEKVGYPVE